MLAPVAPAAVSCVPAQHRRDEPARAPRFPLLDDAQRGPGNLEQRALEQRLLLADPIGELRDGFAIEDRDVLDLVHVELARVERRARAAQRHRGWRRCAAGRPCGWADACAAGSRLRLEAPDLGSPPRTASLLDPTRSRVLPWARSLDAGGSRCVPRIRVRRPTRAPTSGIPSSAAAMASQRPSRYPFAG